MNQQQFILAHEQQWLILEVLLNPNLLVALPESGIRGWWYKISHTRKKLLAKSPNQEKINILDVALIHQADFPALYRDVCQQLSLAQSRRYSPCLIERLSFLVDQAHQMFYQQSHTHGQSALASLMVFFGQTFPRTVRQECRWLWLSSAMFFVPLLLMIGIIQIWPEFVYSILSAENVSTMEAMYDPQAEHIGRERGSDSDSRMFGFYIFNNTGIGFRTFATGLLFGIGSLFTLMFNGLHIGAAAGHLTQLGYGSTFWPFVSGHSAMELMAIALSGAAGLKLGFSLLMPGRKSRYQALLDAAAISVRIMAGAVLMFFIAAFIEAYWSSSQNIDNTIKYAVGLLMWLLVLAYFFFAGHETPAKKMLKTDSGKVDES